MVNLGKLAKKAKGIVDKQGDKIAKGVDKATDIVDKKTKGKYKDKLEKLDDAASKLDKTKKPDNDSPTATTEESPVQKEPGPA